MELGISSLGYLIEYGQMDKFKNTKDLLLSGSKDCLEYCEKNKIKICELILDPPDVLEGDFRKEFCEILNSYSLVKQIHGPFVDVCVCSHNKYIAKASVKSYIETAKLCNELDIEILTVHPGLSNFLIKSIHSTNVKHLIKYTGVLLKEVEDLGIKICMENMPQNTNILLKTEEFLDLINSIRRNDLYITYDTSHHWTCSGNPEIFWEKLSNRIKNIHLVDNFSKESDTHPALGSGKINFKNLFDIFRKYNYSGALIVEIGLAHELDESIKFIRQFL
ncbi:MAG: sugar phosphate isomerase/epimerase family protein [Promethearchaeota archaeon]